MQRKLILIFVILLAISPYLFEPLAAQQQPLQLAVAKVVRIVDGDTFEVEYLQSSGAGLPTIIRPYLIDAPENSPNLRKIECYGPDSEEITKGLLLGRTVWLSHQNSKTRDGRLRAFVYLDATQSSIFQKILVSQGGAEVDIQHDEEKGFMAEMDSLAQEAQNEGRGLWSCSAVFINEFSLSPTGQEWVELYNAEHKPIDLSGWKIIGVHGNQSSEEIDAGTIIPPGGFLVIDIQLDDMDEVIELRHSDGFLVDISKSGRLGGTHPNSSANATCHARIPDGSSEWYGADCTKGLSNNAE